MKTDIQGQLTLKFSQAHRKHQITSEAVENDMTNSGMRNTHCLTRANTQMFCV